MITSDISYITRAIESTRGFPATVLVGRRSLVRFIPLNRDLYRTESHVMLASGTIIIHWQRSTNYKIYNNDNQ